MDIKFDLNLIKEKKKEIVVIAIYAVLFFALIGFTSSISSQIEDKEFDLDLLQRQHDNIKNGNLSEKALKEEEGLLDVELSMLNQKIPTDLTHKTINEMLAEISKDNGNVFTLANCNVSELKGSEQYSEYEVKINSINGNYYQIKALLKYIAEYKVKIKITAIDFSKTVANIKGSMTLIFYGERIEEEGV